MSSDAEYIGIPLPCEEYPDEFCRIGGVPKGMAPERWPMCGECGKPLSFCFSLDLQDPKPIAKKYRYAFFFFCDIKTCSPFYPWGANRIVLLEELDATSPTKHLGPHEFPWYAVGFCEKEEWKRIKAADSQSFADAILNPQFNAEGLAEVPLPGLRNTPETFHLLNQPEWIQDDETPTCPKCAGPVRFIGQVESTFGLPFGVAYAFLCEKECCAEGSYLMYQVD